MTGDSSLGGRIMKSKIVISFGYNAFFIRICSPESLSIFEERNMRKKNDFLLEILSSIFLFCSDGGSLLRTSSVNKAQAIIIIFLSFMPKVETFFSDHY